MRASSRVKPASGRAGAPGSQPGTQPGPQSASSPRLGRAADIRATLQDEIETGKLVPGSPLDERALAERFAVSRTPIREALQQLSARDLVRVAPRQGMHVARLSISQLRAALEFITEAESLCARLAARRVDADVKRALQSALALGEKVAKRKLAAEYSLANALFHEAIYAACRNAYLAEQIRAARRLLQRYRRDFQTPARINKSIADHRRIAAAIADGDEAAAAAAMVAHVAAGTTGFSEFLATAPMSHFEAEGK